MSLFYSTVSGIPAVLVYGTGANTNVLASSEFPCGYYAPSFVRWLEQAHAETSGSAREADEQVARRLGITLRTGP